MDTHLSSSSLLSFFLALLFSVALAASSPDQTPVDFLRCLALDSNNYTSISQLVYTPYNSSFLSIWNFSINPKFDLPSTRKPVVIVTPVDESQIQTVIYCSKRHGLEIRIRGGGHDFEGLSYTADVPFVMIDLFNMRSISIDVKSKTAWVQGGASYGEFYYRLSKVSNTLGFPGGVWSTVGVGGHISGGGYGVLLRKYGLAADHVIDARLIDVNGRILDRKSMGEDLFWAIRGGMASSFGVIVAWKLTLVSMPEKVTVFTIRRTLEQNATSLLHKWQYVAPNIDRDLFLRVQFGSQYISGTSGKKTVQVDFEGAFQGGVDRLIPLMKKSFPELGLMRENCSEMKWIQAALIFAGFSSQQPPEILLDRSAPVKLNIKGKSDYLQRPIPVKALEGMWELLFQNDVTENFTLNPYGGRMSEISPSAIPFPHRAGNLCMMLEAVIFEDQPSEATRIRRLNWLNRFRDYISPYVSKFSRGAYVNYNDLDMGVDNDSYEVASIWGTRYWKNNFKRLVRVKTKVDPGNFFSHPQSVPAFPTSYSDM